MGRRPTIFQQLPSEVGLEAEVDLEAALLVIRVESLITIL